MKTATARGRDVGLAPEPLSRYFCVLGDPTRLRIIQALGESERTVSELVALLDVPRSRVSNHLACLKWCRVVRSQRRGRTSVYRLADGHVSRLIELAASLAQANCDYLSSCSRIGPDWI